MVKSSKRMELANINRSWGNNKDINGRANVKLFNKNKLLYCVAKRLQLLF